ncbi:MAG TPA: glutamate--tRNA ligase [Anaerolineales bacterium]|nr:glutamate--tRNA ligase [Anaerolineales bacterium]
MSDTAPARVRFAPSPTGRFHLGSARSALYDFLYARQTGGQFILRIEDTDRKRFDPNAESELIEGMHWMGIQWDEGPDVGGPFAPYRQSERLDLYQARARELVSTGHAYCCFCSVERLAQVRQAQQRSRQAPHYDGLCRLIPPEQAEARVATGEPHVVRFKTPKDGSTTALDLLRGQITVENSTIDDFILLKSDGNPVYHLAALVDDHEMEITHVLRGSEWLPTFPLHVLIYQAFGWDQPLWVHLSVFLNPSGKGKMSKRHAVDAKGDAMSIYPLDIRQMGYLPEAIINWIALMGWSYDDRTELFTLDELTERFSLEKLNPSPAAVNFSKLDHFNGVYIRGLSVDALAGRLKPFFQAAGLEPDEARLRSITPLIQERIGTLEEAVEIAGFFFRPAVTPDPVLLVGKNMDPRQSAEAARQARGVISTLGTIEPSLLEPRLRELADQLGLSAGQLFGILRIAVTGQPVSPPLIETMHVLGKSEVVERIERAIELLDQHHGAQ